MNKNNQLIPFDNKHMLFYVEIIFHLIVSIRLIIYETSSLIFNYKIVGTSADFFLYAVTGYFFVKGKKFFSYFFPIIVMLHGVITIFSAVFYFIHNGVHVNLMLLFLFFGLYFVCGPVLWFRNLKNRLKNRNNKKIDIFFL